MNGGMSTKTKKILGWILASLVAIVLMVVLFYAISLRTEIRALNTIERIGDYPVYYMSYENIDYDLDEILAYGIDNYQTLVECVSKNLLGFPISIDLDEFIGASCTSFSAETPDNDNLFARNYDYEDTGILLLYSAPVNRYKSISLCDLSAMTYSGDFEITNLLSRLPCLLSVYVPMDGMNEKGVGISVLELPGPPVSQDTAKPDIVSTLMIRLVLDRAANTEEAIELFQKYDMHDSQYLESAIHYFITDSSGSSAVIEYVDNQISIIRDTVYNDYQLTLANHYVTPGKEQIGDFEIGQSQKRYDIITNALNKAQGVMTEYDAMNTLSQATMRDIYYEDSDFMTNTQWSAVYNLDRLTLNLCVGMNYEETYVFSLPTIATTGLTELYRSTSR